MSEILRKLAAHRANLSVREKSELAKVADLLKQKHENRLKTVEGIAKEYGTDDELDLIPLSTQEDLWFCFEGSPMAYWCERRLQDRTAEETLMLVYNSKKSMLCESCKKLRPRCKCEYEFFNWIKE